MAPASPEDICPQTSGPLWAVWRNEAEPCWRNKEPAVESRADQYPPPPARFFPRVHEPFNQVVSQPAPRRAWRKGRPPRVSLPEAQQRSDGRRKERHAAETLTFAGAFAAGPGAWALLVQKWLILMRPDLKLQLVSRKGTKNTAFNNSSQALP